MAKSVLSIGAVLLVLLSAFVKAEDAGSCAVEIAGKEKGMVSKLEEEAKILNGQIKQLSTFAETSRGELEVAREKIETLKAEKENSVAHCEANSLTANTECRRALEASENAKNQAIVQLQEMTSKSELLGSELATQRNEKMKTAEHCADRLTEAERSASQQITALQEKIRVLEESLESVNSMPKWLQEGLATVGSSAGATYETVSQNLKSLTSQQNVQDAMAAGSKYMLVAKTKASDFYVAAQPVIRDASKNAVVFARGAYAKTRELYAVASPHIVKAVTDLKGKVLEIRDSKAVADAMEQGGVVLDELRALLKTQMKTIPSLSPYSSDEIVNLIVYTMLGIPVLLMLSLCGMMCSRGKRSGPSAVPQGRVGGKSGGGHGGRGKGGRRHGHKTQ